MKQSADILLTVGQIRLAGNTPFKMQGELGLLPGSSDQPLSRLRMRKASLSGIAIKRLLQMFSTSDLGRSSSSVSHPCHIGLNAGYSLPVEGFNTTLTTPAGRQRNGRFELNDMVDALPASIERMRRLVSYHQPADFGSMVAPNSSSVLGLNC